MTDYKEHIEEEIWFSAVSQAELSKYDKDAAFSLFQKRVACKQHTGKTRWMRWLRYAAVFAIVAALSYSSFKGGEELVASTFNDIVIEAPRGARTHVVLPDGSVVYLNAESKISYSQGFGFKKRLVSLIGEGYFEVAHNEQLPFIVESGNLRVKVLGTKFNFRDYPADDEAVVSLLEGSVALNVLDSEENAICLTPNHHAVLDKKEGKLKVEDCLAVNAIQWTQDKLLLDGEPLADIVKRLERSYDVTFKIENKQLLDLHFYGDFSCRDQQLTEILDALSATGKIQYRMEGRHVILFQK